MGYLIGIDEAGYAPNLGPLVIAATLWRVPGDPRDYLDLYEQLDGVVCRTAPRALRRQTTTESRAPAPLPIADSKELYTRQTGLQTLETSVLTMLRCAGRSVKDCQQLWTCVAPDAANDIGAIPWHDCFNPRLPLAACPKLLTTTASQVRNGLRAARVKLVNVQARLIFPARFNALVERYGSKGAALSKQTMKLLADLLQTCGKGPILATGDKHGGRNFYGQVLQEQFDEHLIEIYGEGPTLSTYRFGPPQRRVEVCFRVRGEELLPIALASMVAKYLREVSMKAFNDFWCARVPDLKATAGYPVDALRFKRQIAGTQTMLGIDDQVLWRAR